MRVRKKRECRAIKCRLLLCKTRLWNSKVLAAWCSSLSSGVALAQRKSHESRTGHGAVTFGDWLEVTVTTLLPGGHGYPCPRAGFPRDQKTEIQKGLECLWSWLDGGGDPRVALGSTDNSAQRRIPCHNENHSRPHTQTVQACRIWPTISQKLAVEASLPASHSAVCVSRISFRITCAKSRANQQFHG